MEILGSLKLVMWQQHLGLNTTNETPSTSCKLRRTPGRRHKHIRAHSCSPKNWIMELPASSLYHHRSCSCTCKISLCGCQIEGEFFSLKRHPIALIMPRSKLARKLLSLMANRPPRLGTDTPATSTSSPIRTTSSANSDEWLGSRGGGEGAKATTGS